MSTIRTAELTSGWEVQVRPVPPHASFRWQKTHMDLPSRPDRPMVTLTSELTKHDETVPALPDSDEWNDWAARMDIWRKECARIRSEAVFDEMAFSLDYAIVGFRRNDGYSDWLTEPPVDWQPNQALVRHGLIDESNDNLRLAFIHYELLERPADQEAVMALAFPEGEEDTSPVT